MSLEEFMPKLHRGGRPRLNKPGKFAGMMRMTDDLKAYLVSERSVNETLAECTLRLLKGRGLKIGELSKKVEALNSHMSYLDCQIVTLNRNIESQGHELDACYKRIERLEKHSGIAFIEVDNESK